MLYDKIKVEHIKTLNSKFSLEIIDFIFKNPIFTSEQALENSSASSKTVYNLLNKLGDLGVISIDDSEKVYTYRFDKLINIVS